MGKNGLLQSLDLKCPKKLDILRIDKLEEILEPPAENEFPVKKYQLKELELCYINVDPTLVQDKKIDKRMEVLDKFVPHKCLVHLKIENYYGKQYPSWISTLSNLQRLHLENCVWCEKLPSLGELPQLKFLAGYVRLAWSLGVICRTR
jgi:Leucine-rich repeat (LRR) protein